MAAINRGVINTLPSEVLQQIIEIVDDPLLTSLVCKRFAAETLERINAHLIGLCGVFTIAHQGDSALYKARNIFLRVVRDHHRVIQSEKGVYGQYSRVSVDRCRKLIEDLEPSVSDDLLRDFALSLTEINVSNFYNESSELAKVSKIGVQQEILTFFSMKNTEKFRTKSLGIFDKALRFLGASKFREGFSIDLGGKEIMGLHFVRNQLYYLPKDLGNFSLLEVLAIIDCQLLDLPPEIGFLTNLKELDLSFNYLKKIPPELGRCSSLEKLDLTKNRLQSVPIEIGELKKLHSVDLSFNRVSLEKDTILQYVGLDLGSQQVVRRENKRMQSEMLLGYEEKTSWNIMRVWLEHYGRQEVFDNESILKTALTKVPDQSPPVKRDPSGSRFCVCL
ncbi:MAG: leucine-rich repeat domain-containing protein [Simkaniaceae bacterium]|nr:leucine-rich repeat domain-containing protein [Simkaniaceae bacterium]